MTRPGNSASSDAPPDTPIWNPVKLKMMQGGKITSVTINGNDTPAHYCAAANSGVDFIWTEMQHSGGTWDGVQKMWTACPYAKAVPGARIPNANEFDEQHAMDLGALWLEIPTVRSLAEAQEAVKWAYYPPMGGRSAGSMTGINFRDVPGGYRNTINDNLVLTVMIETLSGLADADKIAALPGIDAVFAASSDLGNHSGYKAGDPDYEREINIVHDAALQGAQISLRSLQLARPARLQMLPGSRRPYQCPCRQRSLCRLCRCGEEGAGSAVEYPRQSDGRSLVAGLGAAQNACPRRLKGSTASGVSSRAIQAESALVLRAAKRPHSSQSGWRYRCVFLFALRQKCNSAMLKTAREE